MMPGTLLNLLSLHYVSINAKYDMPTKQSFNNIRKDVTYFKGLGSGKFPTTTPALKPFKRRTLPILPCVPSTFAPFLNATTDWPSLSAPLV